MQINVLCSVKEIDGENIYTPVSSFDVINGYVGDTAYKAYHINPERIVMVNPRTNTCFIDGGMDDCIEFVLERHSAKLIIEYLIP